MKPFDEHLASLKLSLATEELHQEAAASWRRANAEVKTLGNVARLHPAFVEFHLEALKKYLDEIDRVYREVWASDGNDITPEFIRAILVPRVFTTIAVRAGSIEHELELNRARGAGHDHARGHHILAHEMNRLRTRLANRYEVEAIELSKKHLREQRLPKEVPPPINPVWAGGTVRLTSDPAPKPRAPKPPPEVGGRGAAAATGFRNSQASQVPDNPPSYFPNELWPRTQVIMGEAARNFPTQAQALELCKYVIAEMTPVFSSAVEEGKIKSGSVLVQGLGGMADLLHSLLVDNDSGIKSGFSSLSDYAYRLGQELRKSDEWLGLAKAIDAVSRNRRQSIGTQSWTMLERRGDFIVLADSSVDAAAVIRHDYDLLKWNLRKLNQFVSQAKEDTGKLTVDKVKAAFHGTILVGDEKSVPYLTDREIESFIGHPQTPSRFAEEVITKRWGLAASTVRTYLRRKPLLRRR